MVFEDPLFFKPYLRVFIFVAFFQRLPAPRVLGPSGVICVHLYIFLLLSELFHWARSFFIRYFWS